MESNRYIKAEESIIEQELQNTGRYHSGFIRIVRERIWNELKIKRSSSSINTHTRIMMEKQRYREKLNQLSKHDRA